LLFVHFSQFSMLQFLVREYRSHGMGRLAAWILAAGLVLWIIDTFTPVVPGFVWALFWLFALVAAIYYIVRLFRSIRRFLLWRLTRRLIVVYVFIAFVPIALLLGLVTLGGEILTGQFAAFVVRERLQNYASELHRLDDVITREASQTQTRDPRELEDQLESFCVAELAHYQSAYNGLRIGLSVSGDHRLFTAGGNPVKQPLAFPRWLTEKGFVGVAEDRGGFFLLAAAKGQTAAGTLTSMVAVPFSPPLLDRAGRGIGPVAVMLGAGDVTIRNSARGLNVRLRSSRGVTGAIIRSDSIPLPPRTAWYDFEVQGYSAVSPAVWDSSRFTERHAPILVSVSSRIVSLDRQLLHLITGFPNIPLYIFMAVSVVFFLIELIALIFGITLTRTITSTVNRLQKATEHVSAGDFSYRVGLPPRDQISALGVAFDSMTASVERLLAESREKTRLEGELKIAREVQSHLFPQSAPEAPGIELYGTCRAAREVSGDYYDFLVTDSQNVALALGDVSGKGIFAALLMAGIQSAVRAQLYNGQRDMRPASRSCPASLVSKLNRQVYANTPDAKYVTFFYADYDRSSRMLTYTNAGHPPPFLFRRDSLLRLDCGGTVIGLFPHACFEQAQIALEPGDILLAFTDGMTEPENSYGEEFGEARLVAAARQALDDPPHLMAAEIYRRVTDWTGSDEAQDDMTLLYLKAIE
jgi:phosphoserine phosphatase RsbU/P